MLVSTSQPVLICFKHHLLKASQSQILTPPSTPKYADFFCLEYLIPIHQMFLHSITLLSNGGITNFAFCQVATRTNSQTITAVKEQLSVFNPRITKALEDKTTKIRILITVQYLEMKGGWKLHPITICKAHIWQRLKDF